MNKNAALSEAFKRPPEVNTPQVAAWFDALAALLLNRVVVVAGGREFRPVEIEFYFQHPQHHDMFAHADPVQQQCGAWYFHRSGGSYRGGTFKGLDISCGDPQSFGGVLIRGLEEQRVIDGPCLCVEALLNATGQPSVADLDGAIAGRLAWDADSVLSLAEREKLEQRPVLATPRVGLTLKRFAPEDGAEAFVCASHRYLTLPRQIKKGRPQTICALHRQGRTIAEIRQQTGSPQRTIASYVEAYQRGKSHADISRFYGVSVDALTFCEMFGARDA